MAGIEHAKFLVESYPLSIMFFHNRFYNDRLEYNICPVFDLLSFSFVLLAKIFDMVVQLLLLFACKLNCLHRNISQVNALEHLTSS